MKTEPDTNKDTYMIRRTCRGPMKIPTNRENWATFHVNSAGTQIYGKTMGNGTPLLLIHGLGCDSNYFNEAGRLFAQHYQVVTYDRRAYGRSGDEHTIYLNREEFGKIGADDAAAVIDRFGEKFDVFAHSAGGLIALYLLKKYPEKIRRLIIYEVPVPELYSTEDPIFQKIDEINRLKKTSFAKAYLKFRESLGIKSQNRPLSDEEAEFVEKNVRVSLEKEYGVIYDIHNPSLPSWEGDVPIIFAAGTEGEAHMADCMRKLSKQQQGPLYFFRGGHNALLEAPDEATELTEKLLRAPFDKIKEQTN